MMRWSEDQPLSSEAGALEYHRRAFANTPLNYVIRVIVLGLSFLILQMETGNNNTGLENCC